MTKIYRHVDSVEEIEIPEDSVVCPRCEGKGGLSKYDQGWSSLVYDASLAAIEECFMCNGKGYISKNSSFVKG